MIKVKDFEDYFVDENGNIYSNKYSKQRLMKQNVSKKDGYVRIKLYKNNYNKTFLLHRIIADAFIPNHENKKEVNHKDGNKLNNSVSNLEWATPSENVIHSYKQGLQAKKGLAGEKNGHSKLKEADVIIIYKSSEKKSVLADRYGVSFASIYDIKKRRTWVNSTSKCTS